MRITIVKMERISVSVIVNCMVCLLSTSVCFASEKMKSGVVGTEGWWGTIYVRTQLLSWAPTLVKLVKAHDQSL
jgi:hypothetical protein